MAYLHFIRLAWPLGLMLLLQNLVYGFMSNEMSSTRYFTDKGLLPPLSLRQKASNQTTISSSDSPSTLYTTGTSVPLQGCSVPVTYTNDPKSVYRWLSDHLPYEGCIIGFDVEVSVGRVDF